MKETEEYSRFKDYLHDDGFDKHTIEQLDFAVEEIVANSVISALNEHMAEIIAALNKLQRYDERIERAYDGSMVYRDIWGDYVKVDDLAAALGIIVDKTGESCGFREQGEAKT